MLTSQVLCKHSDGERASLETGRRLEEDWKKTGRRLDAKQKQKCTFPFLVTVSSGYYILEMADVNSAHSMYVIPCLH